MTPEQLRNELDARGLSLTEAGRVLRMSRRMVSYLLSGESTITPTREIAIRHYLDEYDREPTE